jgi:hypothetical protein
MSPADLLETMKIEDGAGGFIVINKIDFNASEHAPYIPTAADAPVISEDPVPEEPAIKPALRKRG